MFQSENNPFKMVKITISINSREWQTKCKIQAVIVIFLLKAVKEGREGNKGVEFQKK